MRKLVIIASLLFAFARVACAETWVAGKHYFPVQPAQATNVANGKVEVLEIFSYGCPACFRFYPIMDQLKASLPANAQVNYLPAAWNDAEDWPMFQRAFFAAQSLDIVDRTHNAMFDAVWKTNELAIVDPKTQRLKRPLPNINDAAKFYSRVAKVSSDSFLAASNSFSVASNMKRADAQIKAYQTDQTPTVIVNGKYRVTGGSAGGTQQIIDLVKWLVQKESK